MDGRIAPFLTEMLGDLHVDKADLSCVKREDGKYEYKYKISVSAPGHAANLTASEFSSLSSTFEATTGVISGFSTETSSNGKKPAKSVKAVVPCGDGVECIYMLSVKFILFHVTHNRRAQSTFQDEFRSNVTLSHVLNAFLPECRARVLGDFAPKMSYCVGAVSRSCSHPLNEEDLGKTLHSLLPEASSGRVTIVADATGDPRPTNSF